GGGGRERGGETRPPGVNRSGAGCTIEEDTGVGATEPAGRGGGGFAGAGAGKAVRVGLKYVTGLGEDDAEAVAANRPYSSVRELAHRTELSEDELRALAEAGACDCFGLRRRELLWQLGR